MIEGMNVNRNATEQMLDVMSNHPDFTFYLTGSRFFETQNELSDYDFFAKYDDNLLSWLIDQRFMRISSSDYGLDNLNAVVYRWRPPMSTGPHIDIQLVKDIDVKRMAQGVIIIMGLGDMVSNGAPTARDTWNRAYEVVRKKHRVRGVSTPLTTRTTCSRLKVCPQG